MHVFIKSARVVAQRFLAAITLCAPLVVQAQSTEVCAVVKGAALIAQDDEHTPLGKIGGAYDADSIFNQFGEYGSEFSAKSIWNQFGKFGSEFSAVSPHNKFAITPPMIIKGGKVIGYLTANKNVTPGIAPNLLKALCKDEF